MSELSIAIITGKGPSAIPVIDPCDMVCAVNGAISICDYAHYLFINDYSAFGDFHLQELSRIRALVIPDTFS